MRPLVTLVFLTALLGARSEPAAGQAGASASTGTCGNKLIDAGETCAQCAADCTVQPCRPAQQRAVFSVEFAPPPAPDVSTAVLRIGYRSDRLSLPGTGTEKSVQSRIKSPDHDVMAFNDLDYALRIVASRSKALPAGQLVEIEFDRCVGAPAPTVADLSCEVEACAASTGPESGCQCTISAVAR
jgi:hypothetical protein